MKAEELANAHWQYVEKLLETHEEDEATITKIKFHYKSALVHGYGHRWEDKENEINANR